MVDTLVWITGASAGLGAGLATAVPHPDATVVSISRSPGPDGTEHLPADLADPASWSAVEAHLMARMAAFSGRRAIFVHNAGTLEPIGFAGEVHSAAYRANVLLNSAAGQVLGHAFLRAVNESGFGGFAQVAMISSGAATKAYPGWSAYAAGKAALDHWVRTAGEEQRLRESGISVLAVAPGVVGTAMQERIRSTDEADFPNVDRFRALHDDGQLQDAHAAAVKVWNVLGQGLPAGTITDTRQSG
jgi:benzil reductase ((S)-benzoin forming)